MISLDECTPQEPELPGAIPLASSKSPSGFALATSSLQIPALPTSSPTREAIKVYISLNVVSLFNVDTINETFYVRLVVRLIWCAKHVPCIGSTRETAKEKEREEVKDMINGMEDADRDWRPNWYPEFGIRNRVETQEIVENFVAICTAPPEVENGWKMLPDPDKLGKEDFWIVRQTTMNVVINALEKLQAFPFDVQDLMILIRLEHPSQSVLLTRIEDLPLIVRKAVPSQISVPDATLAINFANLHTAERSYWHRMPCKLRLGNDFVNRPLAQLCGAVHVSIHVQRHMGHYIYNVFLMVGLITTLSAAVWAIPIKDIANRLATDATLLLTIQAFKVSIAEKMPKVNYLTLVDIYILACFLFNLAAACLHIRTGWHGKQRGRDSVDRNMHILWSGMWLAFNLAFILLCFVSRRTRFKNLQKQATRDEFQILSVSDVDVDSMMRRKTLENEEQSTLLWTTPLKAWNRISTAVPT